MPELAEVEYGRAIAERAAVNRTITGLWCDEDDIVFDGVSPDQMRAALLGARVLAVRRHGKQLWFELDRRPWPLFHFGMTGAFRSKDERPLQLASSPKAGDIEWPPRFAKIRMEFDDGGVLVMTNKRRLGRIRLRQDPVAEPPISKLGFDPLNQPPTESEFRQRVRARKSAIKAILLDQGFAAGVGNWLADEICYQARVDPRAKPSSLTDDQLERVRESMLRIVRVAVDLDADKSRFPAEWLFHRRWGKGTGALTVDGHPIEFVEIGGRTTAWVPAVQRSGTSS